MVNWSVWGMPMKLQRSISESWLNQSLVKASDAIVRELALACKKVAIYGALHPVAKRSLERLFSEFKSAFNVKRVVAINLEAGRLHVMSIRQRETVFTEEVLRFLQFLEIRAACFTDLMSQTDLAAFVERLVKREKHQPRPDFVPDYLKSRHISSIEVNSELAHRTFELNLKYRGDIDRDFTVRQIVFEQLGGDLIRLAEIYDGDNNSLDAAAIDFNNEVVQYLLPEKIAAFKSESIIAQLNEIFESAPQPGFRPSLPAKQQKQLGRLVALHPDRSSIINSLHSSHGSRIASLIRESVLPSVTEFSDDLTGALADFETHFLNLKETDAAFYAEMFLRYYRTGRRGQAIEMVDFLLNQFSAPERDIRQKALLFMCECLKNIDPQSDKFILENLVVRLSQIIDARTETLEHAELISGVLEQGCRGRRFEIMIDLVDALAKRRTHSDSVTVYDSPAVKAALLKLNRLDFLNFLIDQLAHGNPSSAKIIQRILSVLGTAEVAHALIKIISHPSRQLRRQVLKILTDLGRPALNVCSAELDHKPNFERPDDRSDLPDYKWYVVRNAIYVLGALKDAAAIESLRRRMSDRDIRVRREIILALEKIGGEEACDLLLLMAEDSAMEIREMALSKLGLIGSPDIAPLLIDLIQRSPHMSVKCVQTIGQLGGEPGKTFLALLLQEEHKSDDITQGRVPKEEFKAAVVRALARLGDEDSIESIKQYRKSLSNTQKLLIKNTALESVLSEVLKSKR